VLVHTVHAERFNRLMEAFSPDSATRLTQVTNLGPETAVTMGEAAARGEWVVMVGDRIAVNEQGSRVAWFPFLGELAPFPVGPYILASLLKCPTYLLFCLRHGDRHHMHFRKLADRVDLPRRHRSEAIESYVRDFVRALEEHTAMAPLQWFNFFDFWRPPGLVPPVNGDREPAEEVRQ
jgi:predicted LPLAT superfamily acyltransferase